VDGDAGCGVVGEAGSDWVHPARDRREVRDDLWGAPGSEIVTP
jgi:hypothetical protein